MSASPSGFGGVGPESGDGGAGDQGAPAGWSDPELEWLCRAALEAAHPQFRGAAIHAAFFPYVGLTHTIRKRGQRWIVRVSDHCRRAPRIVIEAVARLLAAKVMRLRPPRGLMDAYERFRKDPEIETMLRRRRRERGRKRISQPAGKHHSLAEIFREQNDRFFGGRIEVNRIGWGPRHCWGRLGHFDPAHRTITVSPVLDSPKVPGSVLGFIVYHEMLHALFEGEAAGPATDHPPQFRRAERSHPDYAESRRFLARYCRNRSI